MSNPPGISLSKPKTFAIVGTMSILSPFSWEKTWSWTTTPLGPKINENISLKNEIRNALFNELIKETKISTNDQLLDAIINSY